MRGNVDGNAYQAAYKSYSTLEGAAYHCSPTLPADGVLGRARDVKMRHDSNGASAAGVVASYGVCRQDARRDEDDHGFARGHNGRGVMVSATVGGGSAVLVDQRHCPNPPPPPPVPTTSDPEGWMTCCRPIVLLLTLVLLIVVFVFVSGVLLYINYVAYKPRQSYVEEPCEKTFCAWGAQCVTGPDGGARCQCPTHCRPHVDQPVCGGDGRTYESHCHLRMAACRARLNVRVVHEGKCGHSDPCKDKQCAHGGRCVLTPDGRNATCQCPTKCPNYGDHAGSRPVCGSDGQDYENQCELRRAACHAGLNVTVKFPGKCDPCEGVACAAPGVCRLDERRHPACRCDESCPRQYAHVCGSDGRTYPNECALRQEACKLGRTIGVVYRGECSSGRNPCANVRCAPLESCAIDKFGIARCECPAACAPLLKPVCSRDGRTYGSECEMRREACLARADIEIAYVGPCGAGGDPCRGGCRHGGVCVAREGRCECPKCSEVFEPVCGDDGVTYVNECRLRREACSRKTDVGISYVGVCDACLGKACDFHAVCRNDEAEGAATAARCVCPASCEAYEDLKRNETVCGSNGATYASECALRMAACGTGENIMVAYKGDCDLCSGVACKHGGRCEAGECVCPTRCDAAGEESVCASNLTTFRNECELQQAACRQRSAASTAPSLEPARLSVLFYGDCRERFPVPGTFTTESSQLGPTGLTGHSSDITSQTDVPLGSENTPAPSDSCKDIQCDFEATCELGPDNFPRCTCQFNCSTLQEDLKPVCASNMRIYPSLCAMKMEACQSQSELRLRPLDLCQGMEVKPCNGDKPIVDALTNNELDCGNGPSRQDCPSGSYCHQTTRFARCCLKDQSFLQNSCETAWFGCCPDGRTPAQGPDGLGCPLMCGCNKLGSYSEACDPLTNACKCRPGVGGEKCDRCEPGYWGLPKISSGHHGCIPCGCSTFGSVRDDCEQMTGRCVCKPDVQGQKCTECTTPSKTLTSLGCISSDLAKQPVTSCRDLVCHYGASCIERNHLVYCDCPEDNCQGDDPHETVCGSDGQTYPNPCSLRQIACKLQKDIVVQSFGHCKSGTNQDVYGSGTDWPVKHYTPLQFTQSDDSNSPLSKSTRHLLHMQKYQNHKSENGLGWSRQTKQAFRPTPATVRVFTALLGDLCSETSDCPILYSHCIRGACLCLPDHLESSDRQECIQEIPPDVPKVLKTYETPSFKGRSFIRLKPLKAYHKLSLELEFQTFSQDGILFYNQQYQQSERKGPSDFVSLAMRKGYVEFRYNLGDGPVMITSLEKVSLGEFHRVVAKRYHKDGMLQLDDGENVAGQSQGRLRALDLTEDGFLGGVPEGYTVLENVGISEGLHGCIKKFRVGRKSIELYEGLDDLVIQATGIGECSLYKEDVVVENDVSNANLTSPQAEFIPEFDGNGYLQFPALGPTKRSFKVEVVFLSKVKNGLLLYNGQLTNGRGDFVSLALVKGHVQFRFNLGSGIANLTSKEVITTNTWHSVKVTRDGREGELKLDQGEVVRGHSGPPMTELNLELPLFIGSVEKWSETHRLSGVAFPFKGVIQKLSINDHSVGLNLPLCDPSTNLVKNTKKNGCSLNIKRFQGVGPPCLSGPCPPPSENLQNYGITLKKDTFLFYDVNNDPEDPKDEGLDVPDLNHADVNDLDRKNAEIAKDAENDELYDMAQTAKRERGSRYAFRLRAAASDGLLLWRAGGGERFSIALVAGRPEATLRDDTIKSALAIDDGRWHDLRVEIAPDRFALQVDGGNAQGQYFRGAAPRINRRESFYLGSAPSMPPSLPNEYYQSFQGCIHSLSINSKAVALMGHVNASDVAFC